MNKKYKTLLIINIVVFIILVNLKWNSNVLDENRNYETRIAGNKSWLLSFENPPGIETDTITIDNERITNHEAQTRFILSTFNEREKEECSRNRTIYKFLGIKTDNQIVYKRIWLVNYPETSWSYCASDEEASKRNKDVAENIDKIKFEQKTYKFLNHFVTFFMTLQIAMVIYFVIKK